MFVGTVPGDQQPKVHRKVRECNLGSEAHLGQVPLLPLTRCVALDQSIPHDVLRSSLCSGVEGLPCTVTVKQDLNVRVLLKLQLAIHQKWLHFC